MKLRARFYSAGLIFLSVMAISSLIVAENRGLASAAGSDHSAPLPRLGKKVAVTSKKKTTTTAKLPRITPPLAMAPKTQRIALATSSDEGLSVVEQKNITPHHQELAKRVLRLLPLECRKKLKSFYVLYGNPEHRGLAGKGIVIVSGEVSDAEFVALLTHEMAGHFWDITCMNGSSMSGASGFKDGKESLFNDDPSVAFYKISWTSDTVRKKTARDGDFVTGYAQSRDPFEDLAESVSYYLLQPDAFAARAKSNPVLAQKLAWLHQYFPITGRVSNGSEDGSAIAWDATKLGYAWIGQ